jgi:phosphomannomutase/phosphoglucomutase
MFDTIFREYDIRGIYQKDLNEQSVKAIGICLGNVMKERGVKTVCVGYDARTSAPNLFNYLVSGLNAAKLDVYDIGMLPTPVGYFSVFTDKFDANVMITGSHNPKEYNGFKIRW